MALLLPVFGKGKLASILGETHGPCEGNDRRDELCGGDHRRASSAQCRRRSRARRQRYRTAPFDILCSALGACTAITLRMYAERKAWPLRGVQVDVRFSGTGKEGAIARVLKFDGELSEEQRARLADIAERTPVTLTLKNGVAITTTLA